MCKKVGMNLKGIFVFDLSKNTKKANAGLTGLGKSKRIILADTLVEKFSTDEICSVFAHELGHYSLKHIPKSIVLGGLSIFISLFITSLIYNLSTEFFSFSGIADIAALPLLILFLFLYGLVTLPLNNALSRHFEWEADRFAIKFSGDNKSFIGALGKLQKLNLADPNPSSVVEFFFYGHPSIGKRIAAVQKETTQILEE